MSKSDYQYLKESVENSAKSVEQILRSGDMDTLLDIVLGVERTQSLFENGYETVKYTLTLATGGPNIYLDVDSREAKIVGYWGTLRYEKKLDVNARELFEQLKEIFDVE